MALIPITPLQAAELKEKTDPVFIDIREPEEFKTLRIPGARLKPLSVLPFLPPDTDPGRPAVFFCRSGRRTAANAEMLERLGHSSSYLLEGGLEAWRTAGLPVEACPGGIPLARQTQIAAGVLVLLFFLLGFSSPVFLWGTAFVGAGLVFAGLTGFCGMALLLEKMPWNKK